jgi:hypothetical protein
MTTTLLKTIADLKVYLDGAVNVGDTTATLQDAEDSEGVALPSGKYGFTIDNNTESKEYFVCDLVGTALINIQSITVQGAASSGFSQYHRHSAPIIITDWAVLKRILNNLDGTTGFDSAAPLGYDGAPSALVGNQFATVNYVLSVVAGGTVSFDQQVLPNQTLGETVSLNDVVYFKTSDQRWWKADADLSATFSGVKLGICKTAGIAGGSTTIAISGPVSGFSLLTPGSTYYLSNTAGGISTSVGTTTVSVGIALSASVILLDPWFTTIASQAEKDAMAGFGAAPSSTNLFVTQAGLKFGGTGADGALSVAAGTTTIDCANAAIVIKNYTSMSIAVGATLAFSNPHANGTIVILKCRGACTISGTIDASSMGAEGGQGAPTGGTGNNPTGALVSTWGGVGGASTSGGAGGAVPTVDAAFMTSASTRLYRKTIFLAAGAGGGGGGDGNTFGGGDGGRGGGAIYIECAGALNFAATGVINTSGGVGQDAPASSGGNATGGGGGGGSAGMIVVLYNSLTANAGTLTATGGAGGAGGTADGATGAHGGGGGGAASLTFAGGSGASASGAAGSAAGGTGAGGGGGAGRDGAGAGGAGGAGGATMSGLVTANSDLD